MCSPSTTDHELRLAVDERIAELRRWRRWLVDRQWTGWRDLDAEYRAELIALLKLRHAARKRSRVESRGDHFVGVGR